MIRVVFLSIFLFINFGNEMLQAQNPGEIDTTYGDNGTNEFWLEINGVIHGLRAEESYLLPDNKLLMAGITTSGCSGYSISTGVLFVIDQSGQLDTSYFDGVGYREFPGISSFYDMIRAPDGDYLLLEVTKIWKINLDSGIDESFANGGSISLGFNGSAMYFDATGNLLVRGWQNNYSSPDNRDRLLAKYSPDMLIDSTFGINGIMNVYPTESANFFNDIKFDSYGNYYLVGTSRYDYNFVDKHILITKLLPNGDLDSSYADNGRFEESNLYRSQNGGSYFTGEDELIIQGTTDPTSSYPSSWEMLMFKIDNTGTVDTTFGTNGYTTYLYPGGAGSIKFLQPLPTGGFLLAGSGGFLDKSMFLARCTEDGIFDPNFGEGGFKFYSVPNDNGGMSKGILVDNKLVTYGLSSYAECAQTKWKSWFRRFAIGELNNSCQDAIPLNVNIPSSCPDSATVGSIGYCSPSGMANGCGTDNMPDVFYSFDTDSDSLITIDFHSENEAIYTIEILDSCGGNSLICTTTTDTVLSTELSPNSSYIIRVAGNPLMAANETFTICLSGAPESALLSGNIALVGNCVSDSARFAFYIPATDSLLFSYNVPISPSGDYSIILDSIGIFDVLVSMNGFLDKGYTDVLIHGGENHLDAHLLRNCDINNDGMISIFDISSLSIAFLTQLGDLNFNSAADLDCNTIINITDISILSASYLMVDDTVPLQ